MALIRCGSKARHSQGALIFLCFEKCMGGIGMVILLLLYLYLYSTYSSITALSLTAFFKTQLFALIEEVEEDGSTSGQLVFMTINWDQYHWFPWRHLLTLNEGILGIPPLSPSKPPTPKPLPSLLSNNASIVPLIPKVHTYTDYHINTIKHKVSD